MALPKQPDLVLERLSRCVHAWPIRTYDRGRMFGYGRPGFRRCSSRHQQPDSHHRANTTAVCFDSWCIHDCCQDERNPPGQLPSESSQSTPPRRPRCCVAEQTGTPPGKWRVGKHRRVSVCRHAPSNSHVDSIRQMELRVHFRGQMRDLTFFLRLRISSLTCLVTAWSVVRPETKARVWIRRRVVDQQRDNVTKYFLTPQELDVFKQMMRNWVVSERPMGRKQAQTRCVMHEEGGHPLGSSH